MEESNEPILPEVQPGKKRKFPQDVRQQVLNYHDNLPDDGSKGAYLRRSGLYDSTLATWRQQLTEITPTPLGRKPLTVEQKEIRKLREANRALEAELEKANAIIDVQKKVSALFEMYATPKEQRG